jgi:acetyltransferase-like isoleucine patch superfamily enzyme
VVTHAIPDYAIAAGVPAKVVRYRKSTAAGAANGEDAILGSNREL